MTRARSDTLFRQPPSATYSLYESLSFAMLKLPRKAVIEIGPASQSLAGILMDTHKTSFRSASNFANNAKVPLRTFRRHLDALIEGKWVVNEGRQHTPKGNPRRTCTLKIPAASVAAQKDYLLLPLWACGSFAGTPLGNKTFSMNWSTRVLFAVIISRMASLKAAITRHLSETEPDEDEYWGHIANFGDVGRFKFSLAFLQRETGLAKHSLIDAKNVLRGLHLIRHRSTARDDGGDDADLLWPNEEIRIIETPATPGRIYRYLGYQAGDKFSTRPPVQK